MTTLASQNLTLADWAKRLDPDGRTATVVELLSQTNQMLDDMTFIEGNLPVGHRLTVRTGLPTVYWRLLNAGVQTSKSRTAQVDEQCGMLEAYSEVDTALAALNGNTAAFRLSEAQAFVEAMNQEMQGTVIYGNGGLAPEEFTGLSLRYSSLSAASGQNVISASGAQSDNTSIWLIVWGPNTVHGIFPKGSNAGLSHRDLGEVTVENAGGVTGARMQAYREHWKWNMGVCVKDWRYAVRIANIDVSSVVAESSAADLIKLMSRAIDRIPAFGMGRPVFYCNRTIRSFLRIQALAKSYTALSAQASLDQFGNPVRNDMNFSGIPIKLCDQIVENEAVVS